jgi:hypothetical protein
MARFMPQLLYAQGMPLPHPYPLRRGPGCAQSWSGCFGNREKSLSPFKIEPPFLGHMAHGLVTVKTTHKEREV